MDTCTVWEINDIIENLPYMDRALWETARLNAYVVAQVNSTKKITQQDILKFKWEEESQIVKSDPADIEITNEDIQRLNDLSKQLETATWEDTDLSTIPGTLKQPQKKS